MIGYYNLFILAGYGVAFFAVTMLIARKGRRSRSQYQGRPAAQKKENEVTPPGVAALRATRTT